MESYLRGTVLKYIEMVKKQLGKDVNLQTKKRAPTLFLPEDQKESPAGRLLSFNKACICPSCMHSFPVWTKTEGPPNLISPGTDGFDPNSDDFQWGSPIYDNIDGIPVLRSDGSKKRAIDPKKWYMKMHYTNGERMKSGYIHSSDCDDEVASTNAPSSDAESLADHDDIGTVDGKPRGQFNKIAASILMRILYCARMTRFDFLRATCRLATRISRWTKQDDKRLLRIRLHIWHHLNDRQVGVIGNNIDQTSLRLFCDADFAGDPTSQRSTRGVHLALHGSHAIYPLQGLPAKQDAVACSTPEAEFYAGCMGYRKVMIPSLEFWDISGPNMLVPMFHEDNQAMILIVLYRVSAQWLHARIGRHPDKDPTLLFYEDTANMPADVYTKGFSTPDSWGRAICRIKVFRPHEIEPSFLGAWLDERHEIGRANSVHETRQFIVAKQAQKRDAQREKGHNIIAAAKVAPKPSKRITARSSVKAQASPAPFVSMPNVYASDCFVAAPAVSLSLPSVSLCIDCPSLDDECVHPACCAYEMSDCDEYELNACSVCIDTCADESVIEDTSHVDASIESVYVSAVGGSSALAHAARVKRPSVTGTLVRYSGSQLAPLACEQSDPLGSCIVATQPPDKPQKPSLARSFLKLMPRWSDLDITAGLRESRPSASKVDTALSTRLVPIEFHNIIPVFDSAEAVPPPPKRDAGYDARRPGAAGFLMNHLRHRHLSLII